MNPPQPSVTGTTNELAKQRNRDAAARTLTAWMQNCIKLMGFGIALDQISRALHQAFPKIDLLNSQQVAKEIGLSLIALSVSLLLIAMRQHQIEMIAIERDDYLFLSGRPLIMTTITTVILFGIIAVIILFFQSL